MAIFELCNSWVQFDFQMLYSRRPSAKMKPRHIVARSGCCTAINSVKTAEIIYSSYLKSLPQFYWQLKEIKCIIVEQKLLNFKTASFKSENQPSNVYACDSSTVKSDIAYARRRSPSRSHYTGSGANRAGQHMRDCKEKEIAKHSIPHTHTHTHGRTHYRTSSVWCMLLLPNKTPFVSYHTHWSFSGQ